MLRDGKTGKEIAAELGVAYKTVDNLRAFAYQRIKVNKLALMIKWLYENKL
jgi:FixJ family two-component response regulator